MLNRGVFSEINGCVSTGKEANVYHAAAANGSEMAIKIYKTSILVFKDRDRCGLMEGRAEGRLCCPCLWCSGWPRSWMICTAREPFAPYLLLSPERSLLPLPPPSSPPSCCRYVSGDFRFRNGYCKSNPRKMVQMWAEKEMRNLARLRQVGGGWEGKG